MEFATRLLSLLSAAIMLITGLYVMTMLSTFLSETVKVTLLLGVIAHMLMHINQCFRSGSHSDALIGADKAK